MVVDNDQLMVDIYSQQRRTPRQPEHRQRSCTTWGINRADTGNAPAVGPSFRPCAAECKSAWERLHASTGTGVGQARKPANAQNCDGPLSEMLNRADDPECECRVRPLPLAV